MITSRPCLFSQTRSGLLIIYYRLQVYTTNVIIPTVVIMRSHHEDALFLFQMNTADATTHVAAPSARYRFMLS